MSVVSYCQKFGETFQEIPQRPGTSSQSVEGREKLYKMSAKGQRQSTYDPNLVEVKAKVS